jgi:hypothetical protein
MEPALSALLLGPAIPGDRQGLQPSVREFDEVLLQRIDPEGVFHLERGELAVGAIGLDEEFPILAEEPGVHAVIVKARVEEIAKHRFVGRVLHGEFVLRAVPELRLHRMALSAGLAADKCGLSRGAEKMRPRRVSAGEPCRAARDHRDSRGSSNDYDPRTRKHCRISTQRALNVGYSNAKIRFQSFFMLITVQPSFFASSYSACVKVPTLLSGRPWAGP